LGTAYLYTRKVVEENEYPEELIEESLFFSDEWPWVPSE